MNKHFVGWFMGSKLWMEVPEEFPKKILKEYVKANLYFIKKQLNK